MRHLHLALTVRVAEQQAAAIMRGLNIPSKRHSVIVSWCTLLDKMNIPVSRKMERALTDKVNVLTTPNRRTAAFFPG